MAITINVNDLTLCHRGSGGVTHNTLPDVCKTPGKGVPKPYENEAYSKDLAKGSASVFADGGNSIANFGSEFATSVLDEGGGMGGVLSGTNLAEADWISHSFDVFIEGKPACRLTDKMFMNHHNTVNLAGLCQGDLTKDRLTDLLCKIAVDCMVYHDPNGENPLGEKSGIYTYQKCVENKIKEQCYFNGYPLPGAEIWVEVSFLRAASWAMKGSKADPDLPTSAPVVPNSRRLDIGWRDGSGFKTLFDMKFPDDVTRGKGMPPKRKDDYREIAKRHAGSRDNYEEFDVKERCKKALAAAGLAQPAPAPVTEPAEPNTGPAEPAPAPAPDGREVPSVTVTGKRGLSAGQKAMAGVAALALVAFCASPAGRLACGLALVGGLASKP